MKYKAIIETNDYKDFEFFEDGNGKYIHGIDAGAVNSEWIALYFTEVEQENILDKIRAEITDWQTDIHDNEYDAEIHDFVFERIYEIIDEYKGKREG